MQKSEWASWVQAFGAIAAIGIAIWVASKQYRDARAMQEANRIERISEIYAPVIAMLTASVDQIRNAFNAATKQRQQGAFGVDESFYTGRVLLKAALEATPVNTMPTYESARLLLAGRELLIESDKMMGALGAKFDLLTTVTQEDMDAFMAHLNALSDVRNKLTFDADKLKRRQWPYEFRDANRTD